MKIVSNLFLVGLLILLSSNATAQKYKSRSKFVHEALYGYADIASDYNIVIKMDFYGRKGYLIWPGNPFDGYYAPIKMTKPKLLRTILKDVVIYMDSSAFNHYSREYYVFEDELVLKDEQLEDILAKYCPDNELPLWQGNLTNSLIVFLFNHNVFTYGNCDGAVVCYGHKSRKQEKEDRKKMQEK